MRPDAQTRAALVEVASCLLVGVAWMLLCEHKLAPGLLIEGGSTASDIGEHFWMLHAVSDPGWANFSINRYVLPTLIARSTCFAETAYGCWRMTAFWSTGLLGAAMYLWGRAVGGRAAGFATVVLAAAFSELVVNARTVTAYPLILAIWTAGGALGALALFRPSWWSVLLASIGVGAVFASDARGLLVGLPMLLVLVFATVRAGWRSIPGAVLPIVLSWTLSAAVPVKPLPLEALLEATVEMSYTRARQLPPPRLQWGAQGWVWGHSDLRRLPDTFVYLRAASARIYSESGPYSQQARLVQKYLQPLLWPVVFLLAGLPFALARAPVRALSLLPAAPLLAMLYNAWTVEYYERYAALGMSALAVLCGVGLTGWLGLLFRRWLAVVVAILLLTVLPTPLSLHAEWRRPFTAQKDLQRCLAGTVDPNLAVDECVRATQLPLKPIASPR